MGRGQRTWRARQRTRPNERTRQTARCNHGARRAALRATGSLVLASGAVDIAPRSASTHRPLPRPATRALPSGHVAAVAALTTDAALRKSPSWSTAAGARERPAGV